MQIGQTVTFNSEIHGEQTGTITRIWPKGNLVTVKAPGAIAGTTRTFVREITSVKPA